MKLKKLPTIAALIISVTAINITIAEARDNGRGAMGAPIVYVNSQGLYYDSIALTSLPMKGNFQQLILQDDESLSTEFGPGDVGYLGGRWWLDANNNDEMDEGDVYFMCPLLGPGREEM